MAEVALGYDFLGCPVPGISDFFSLKKPLPQNLKKSQIHLYQKNARNPYRIRFVISAWLYASYMPVSCSGVKIKNLTEKIN